MPNQRKRNKKSGSQIAPLAAAPTKARSVKDLLARTVPVLAPISDQATRQADLRQWLAERLPESLSDRLTGVVERDGALVIFAESAGWSVRLRYAVAEVEEELRRDYPAITKVTIRVLPRTARPLRP